MTSQGYRQLCTLEKW